MAIGLVAIGGIALGGVAIGGMPIGFISLGGMAFGLLMAVGGLAAGVFAAGGIDVRGGGDRLPCKGPAGPDARSDAVGLSFAAWGLATRRGDGNRGGD